MKMSCCDSVSGLIHKEECREDPVLYRAVAWEPLAGSVRL